MPFTRITTPPNRLSRFLGGPGAVASDDLVREAEARVAELKPQLLDFIALEIETILAIGGQSEEIVFAECRALADAALRVAEVAGAADAHALGEVARGIRAMVESLFIAGVWHSDALRLHVEAIAMLAHGPEQSPEELRVITERLRRMRQRIGVID